MMSITMSFRSSLYSSKQYSFPGVRLFLSKQTSMRYRYVPLTNNEIRLIALHPASDGPELCVSFKCIAIEEAVGIYEALSYTWGSSTEPHVLLCGEGHLEITTNLQSALLNLRLDLTPRMLWVDAICINQGDLVERGRQVALMEQIYRNASKTIVYLGEKSADSDLAAAYLENHMWRVRGAIADFMNQRRTAEDPAEMMQICIKTLGASQSKLFEGFDQHEVQRALMNLLSRPWFRRIWVIQEFVVSRSVEMYCGKTLCEWGSFSMMFYYSFTEAKVSWDHINVSSEQKIDFYRGLTQIMQMHELRNNFHGEDENNRKLKNLVHMLSLCRTAEATLPVDKIFALLNLVSRSHNPEPEYLKSKADVYREFAEFTLRNGDGAIILSEAALTNRGDPSLPSWVPDWSEAPARINLSQTLIASEGMFFNADGSRSAGEQRPKPRLRVEGNVLFAQGVILQTIAVVGPDRPVPGANLHDAPNITNLITILSYIQMFLGMEGAYPTGEDKRTVAAILLEADQIKSPRNVTSFWENTHSRDLMFEPELSSLGPDAGPIPEAMRMRRLEDPQGYANMCRAVAGRRFAITDHGYVGLVPDMTRDGDKVCVLKGVNVPFVLREVGEQQYILVGDAYVHGIMQGEAFVRDGTLEGSIVEIAIC
ncbi:HET-domain-containing protein [Xylaria cf. heliscus]|nr:HET-domain-containing protein [Xylaria cf. heliscus]